MALDKNLKKDWKPKLPTCKWCNAYGKHYSWQCSKNPRLKKSLKPKVYIKKESSRTKVKRLNFRKEWFKQNPPDENGNWTCYLQISPDCPIRLDRSTIILEHVKPRQRHPELKYIISNVKPSCTSCNYSKAGNELEELPSSFRIKTDLNAE